MKVQFGPGSPNWVSYSDVSPFLEAALLVSEDGRFFRHDGFDDRAIESAVSDNAQAGRFVRGASTITMQLAKNLYLSRDKTLSRKFQEAALTSLLEQSFEKNELLELYVNVVEFGQGIYGIGPAAEYYFNTTPAALTPGQAFFLGSILPNPKREFFQENGAIKPATFQYVQRLLEIAKQRGRLSDEQLGAALAEELRFGESNTAPSLPQAPQHADIPAEADLTRDENERPAHALPPRRGIEL
jgi:membrane peptidoglycan carboxypeptidase